MVAKDGIGSLRVRGRVRDEHLTRSALRLIAHGRLCLERHLAREQDALGYGVVPHGRSLLGAEGDRALGGGPHTQSLGRSDRGSAFDRQRPRRHGLLPALQLPHCGPILLQILSY